MRPSNLCRLTSGKALAAFPTFVATFNWLVDFCNNLTGGKYVEIDRRDPDHPIIKVNIDGGGGGGSSVPLDASFKAITDIALVDGAVRVKTREFVAENGVLASIGDESGWTKKIPTTPHSSEYGD